MRAELIFGGRARREHGRLPLPLAGEGWGEGPCNLGRLAKCPHPTAFRRSTSPASGRGEASARHCKSSQLPSITRVELGELRLQLFQDRVRIAAGFLDI